MAVHERLLKHACVILAALALPALLPRAGDHLASAAGISRLGDQGDVVLSGATIERNPLAPGLIERPAQTIIVNRGDTIDSLAAAFHADSGAIRWANAITDTSQPAVGSALLIPPGRGALVAVQRGGESPSHLAARLGLDPRVILDYNALHSDVPLAPGSYLQVPRAAAPSSALLTSEVVPSSSARVPAVPSSQYSHGASGQFPWGQCTYYVSSRRVVTWSGNAGMWFNNAREAGRPEGMVPVPGAIVVLGGGWVGHVAYVERVNPDGSFLVSEMNVRGLGVYSERTLTMQGFDLIGFIY